MYIDYHPTEMCYDKTESAVAAWKALEPAERQELAQAFPRLIAKINRFGFQQIGEKSRVELYGKIGMWLANRKQYADPALLLAEKVTP